VRATRHGFTALLVLALALGLTFLLLPVVAIFLELPLGRLLDEIGSDVARDALVVTLKTNLVANALILAVGTPAAYLVATRRFRGRTLVVTLFELPLVLPPAVAGIGLLAAFGSQGLLGEEIQALGLEIAFTQVAVIMAVTFVASPFYVRQAIAAFEAVDPTMLEAARTLGSRPARTFARIALPLAASGLSAGAALAFARGLGEFGATIMFAGSLQGVTQTLPLAIYEQFDIDFDVALAISAFLVVVSGALLLAIKLVPTWARSGWTSPFAFARSASS
jgi:molybdate transport system permease protein